MKAINNKLPFRKVLTFSLITAQLLSAQLVGSYAFAQNAGIPKSPRFSGQAKPTVGGKPGAPTPAQSGLSRDKQQTGNFSAPKKDDVETEDENEDSEEQETAAPAKPAEKATEITATSTPAPSEKAAPVETAAPSSNNIRVSDNDEIQGKPRFNVEVQEGDEKKSYTVEANVVESTSTSTPTTRYAFKDGKYYSYTTETPQESKRYKAELTVYDSDGTFVCSSDAGCLETPDVTNQLHDLNAVVSNAAKNGIVKIAQKRKADKEKQEKEDKLLKSCKAVRNEDGEIVKISKKNRLDHFDAVLSCYVDNATEDKDADKDDEELTVKELRDKKKIGGLLQDAMNHEDSDIRAQAIDGIDSLINQFGDTSKSVRSYLGVLEDGAQQLDRIKTQHTMQDLNDSVGAWNPRNYLHKSAAYQAAVSDVFSGFQSFACENTTAYRQGSNSGLLNCSSSTEDVGNVPGSNGGGLRRVTAGQNTQFANTQQFPNNQFPNNGIQQNNFPGGVPNAGAIYNANQRGQQFPNLANPNQYNVNGQANGNLGRRF